MSVFVLDPQQESELAKVVEPLEVRASNGLILGHFLPTAAYQRLLYASAEQACPISPAELEQRRTGPEGMLLAEFLQQASQK